ncbi:MAG: LysR family transcriptional regulator [Clostridia bacterium]
MSRRKLNRYFRHGMLPQLIAFDAVVRAGGVTRAAEELCLAQPTVSTMLKKLSDALEVRLFEKCGRGMQLTAAGEALYEDCAGILAAVEQAEARLDALRRPANNAASYGSRAWTSPAATTQPPT